MTGRNSVHLMYFNLEMVANQSLSLKATFSKQVLVFIILGYKRQHLEVMRTDLVRCAALLLISHPVGGEIDAALLALPEGLGQAVGIAKH